jgi:hypothetical protein
MVPAWNFRGGNLQEVLDRYKPVIVHFSGHGSPSGDLILTPDDDPSQDREIGRKPDAGRDKNLLPGQVPTRALAQAFSLVKDRVRCVVLNACYSAAQADAIAEHIDGVIGMSKAIGDKAAIAFAEEFYRSLAEGADVKAAFDKAVLQIPLAGQPGSETPRLHCRPGADLKQTKFV